MPGHTSKDDRESHVREQRDGVTRDYCEHMRRIGRRTTKRDAEEKVRRIIVEQEKRGNIK